MDVERSFNMVEEPRKSELRSQLQTIISTYCAKYDVAYWQGMHDMVAVLLLMEPQPPLPKIFLLLSMFLQTFLPYVFDDHDCMFLHHLFEMIRLLLQYHDPRNVPSSPLTVSELALYLQSHNVIPSIFSPPWLLTLFAHDMSQPLLLTIWDQYIFYKNPAIHVFTVLSHLISNKQRILTYPPSELLQLITHLPFENDESSFLFDEHAEAGSQTLPLVWSVRSQVESNTWMASATNSLTITTLPVAYRNSIFTEFSLPDPDVIRADDGYFYLYATEHDRSDARMRNVPIMRSSDLMTWTRVGAMFTDQNHPQITNGNAGIWAPSINRIGDKYVCYYSQPGDSFKHAIGVAVADSPTGPFVDHGKLIDSNEQGVDISIDAYLYQEDGRNYLFWGSFRNISVLELTEDGLAIKNKETQKRREVAGGQYEATVVVKRDGWYYLIVSTGDYSKGGTYRLVVGRSQSLFGPYVDKDGNDMMQVNDELVLQGNDTFSSPGHCSRLITDDNGQDWILYHAYTKELNYRTLMLDRVNWVDGWPVSPGQQPTSASVDRPVFH